MVVTIESTMALSKTSRPAGNIETRPGVTRLRMCKPKSLDIHLSGGNEGEVAILGNQVAAEFQKGDVEIPIAFGLFEITRDVVTLTRPGLRHGLGIDVWRIADNDVEAAGLHAGLYDVVELDTPVEGEIAGDAFILD